MPNKLEVEFSMQKWQWRETIPMPTNAKRYCKIRCREKNQNVETISER